MTLGMFARVLLIVSATGRACAAKRVRSESFEGNGALYPDISVEIIGQKRNDGPAEGVILRCCAIEEAEVVFLRKLLEAFGDALALDCIKGEVLLLCVVLVHVSVTCP